MGDVQGWRLQFVVWESDKFSGRSSLARPPSFRPGVLCWAVRWQSQQQAPTLSAEEAESEDLEESSLDVFRDDSEVPLKEVLRVQEEPLVENADDVIEFNDHDYKLEDRVAWSQMLMLRQLSLSVLTM